MKTLLSIFLATILAFSFTSCDRTLDINEDPLAATSANPNAVLPFVFAEYSARKTTELGTRTCDVYQYYSNTFNSPKGGSISSFLTGNTWAVWYTNLLGNLVLVEQDAAAAGETSNNIQAVAKIMKGHLFFELTSIWGDVPFTEALDGVEYPTPNFDSQETVLEGVVTLMDEAMDLIDAMPSTGNFDFSSGDLIFNGDINRWRELANSIKIRTLMLIRNVNASESNAETRLATAFTEATVSSPVFLKYEGTSTATNAYFDIIKQFLGPSNEDPSNGLPFGPAPALLNFLNANNDPRANLWINNPSLPAADYGTFPSGTTEAIFSDNLLRADYPDIYFLPSEIDLYRAELILDGVLTGNAQTAFEDGVRYAVNYWGGNIDGFSGTAVSATDVDAFITGLGTVSLQKIHEQLWLEAFLRPVVAWNTVRRTGTPALSPPPGAAITTILKRFDYPPDEVAANPNTPANPDTDTPMWFEDL